MEDTKSEKNYEEVCFLDDKYVALHSDTTQWQAIAGYNDFYDWVFDAATDMRNLPIKFKLNGQGYAVWAWKGNYLNLGAGAEVGFYKKDNNAQSDGIEHYVVDRTFPMTLSLYHAKGEGEYSTYYNWMPDMEQWWITGFVPNVNDWSVKADELVMVASVDFSKETDFFYEIMKEFESEKDSKYLIFDEREYTLWIIR